jgi:hypothetical protein
VKAPISNNHQTGTSKEQNHGNATYHEILDVTDYEVIPEAPKKQAKAYAKADTFDSGGRKYPPRWGTSPRLRKY